MRARCRCLDPGEGPAMIVNSEAGQRPPGGRPCRGGVRLRRGPGPGPVGGRGHAASSGASAATSSSPSDFLNQVALAQMNHVRGPMQNNVYANNPNSYINHVRDNGFVDRYYPDRIAIRPTTAMRSRPRAQRTTPTAATVAPSRPLVPLTSFYQRQGAIRLAGRCPDGRRPQGKAGRFRQGLPGRPGRGQEERGRLDRLGDRSPPETAGIWPPGPEIHQGTRDPSRRRQLPCVPAVALRLARPGGECVLS